MNLKAFALTASLVLLALARADDANWSTFGGAGAFTSNRQVRMEREDVRISLNDEAIKVHATFWFRNRGPATTVQMGFPDETHDQGRSTELPLRDFRSSVDGKPVKVVHRTLKRSFNPKTELYAFRTAWVKTVSFSRNGTRKVEVWYTAAHGFQGAEALDTYVFKTGATWRGTIGRIETTVDWTRLRERSRPALTLTAPAPGARWSRVGFRRERLVVENVEPRFDLDLSTLDGFWNFRMNGRPLAQATGIDDYGDVVSGPPEDLRIAAERIGTLFDEGYRPGRYEAGDTVWRAPEARRFGRLRFVAPGTLVASKGRKLRLAHPAMDRQGRPLREGEAPYVRLRDVVRALGGSYTYVPREERVDLHLPGRRAPSPHQASTRPQGSRTPAARSGPS